MTSECTGPVDPLADDSVDLRGMGAGQDGLPLRTPRHSARLLHEIKSLPLQLHASVYIGPLSLI